MNTHTKIALGTLLGLLAGWGLGTRFADPGKNNDAASASATSHDEHGHGAEEHESEAAPLGEEDHEATEGSHAEEGHEEAGHTEPAEPGVIPDSLLARAGIVLDTVRSAPVALTLSLPGRIRVHPSRSFQAAARFPGIVKSWSSQVGERVSAGQILATIESDATLEPYEVKAARSGTLLRLHAAPGQAVQAGTILAEFADLGTMVADLQAGPHDIERIRKGQTVVLVSDRNDRPIRARIGAILPEVDRATQTRVVRIEVPNPTGRFAEGLFVQGKVEIETAVAPLTVPVSALQSQKGRTVVYVREGARFEPRDVGLGRRGLERQEVLAGLRAGEVVAGDGSFVVKADLGKGEASHEH